MPFTKRKFIRRPVRRSESTGGSSNRSAGGKQPPLQKKSGFTVRKISSHGTPQNKIRQTNQIQQK
ncbi:hypothetical protein KKD19_05110, partial [Patescibacteria group bacterium]|nr:hypothetical protein [Patescibacteria group bacterium]